MWKESFCQTLRLLTIFNWRASREIDTYISEKEKPKSDPYKYAEQYDFKPKCDLKNHTVILYQHSKVLQQMVLEQ